jgi:hypothetical protein
VNLYQIMASPEHFYTAYALGEKPAPPGVIARTYSNPTSFEMSSTVSQVATGADLKQLERTILRIWHEYRKTGTCKSSPNSFLVRRLFRYNGTTSRPPNGPGYESVTNNRDHRVYGHMPNSLMWVQPPAAVPAVPRTAVAVILKH